MDGNFKKEVIDRSLDDIKVELDEEFDGRKESSTTVSDHLCSEAAD